MTPLNTIFTYFETGDFPTQEQFQATFSSFFHKGSMIPVASIEGITQLFQNTATAESVTNHIDDANAHAGFLAKLDSSNLTVTNVAEWKSKLGIIEIATIDVPGTDGNVYDKVQIDAFINNLINADVDINAAIESLEALLSSNDLNLDELQEIVNYVKQNRADLEALQNATIGGVDDVDVNLTATIPNFETPTNQQALNIALAGAITALRIAIDDSRYETTVSASGIVTHNLNTYDVDVVLYDTGTRYNADARIYRPTTNTIEIFFDTEPTNPIKVIVKAI